MAKQFEETILFGQDARDALVRGITTLAMAVKSTLGPCGAISILGNSGVVRATKDGVSVARAITLPNRWDDIAARLVRDVAINSEKNAGDGTTTSTVIAEAMTLIGLDLIKSGVKPNQVVRTMSKLVNYAVEYTRDTKAVADTIGSLRMVAEISANAEAFNDYGLAHMAAQAVYDTGKFGRINLKDGYGDDDQLTHIKGYSFARGIHPIQAGLVCTSNIKHQKVSVLMTQSEIDSIEVMERIVLAYAQYQQTHQVSQPLVLICGNSEDAVVASVSAMCMQLRIAPIYVVRAPGAGSQQAGLLTDMCHVCNTEVMPPNAQASDEFNIAKFLGTMLDVNIGKASFTFTFDMDATDYLEQLSAYRDTVASEYERNVVGERMARLSGGIAEISVGGHTDTERGERKDRYDDATKAARGAFNEGVVVGGGYNLLECYKEIIRSDLDFKGLESILIVPFKQILLNAEYTVGEIDTIIKEHDNGKYIDVQDGDYMTRDQYKVIDPVLVTTQALENALSIAKIVLQTKTIIGPSQSEVSVYG